MPFEIYRAACCATVLGCLCLLRRRLSGDVCVPPLFRSYLSAEVAFCAFGGAMLFTRWADSQAHLAYYQAAGILMAAFRIAAILAVAWRLKVKAQPLAIFAGAALGLAWLSAASWISWQSALWHLQAGALLAVLFGIASSNGLRIGANIGGALAFFAINIIAHYLIWGASTVGVPYGSIRWFIQPPGILSSLAAFALLWRRDEPMLAAGGAQC